jgi:hypothetical protein
VVRICAGSITAPLAATDHVPDGSAARSRHIRSNVAEVDAPRSRRRSSTAASAA